MPSLASRGNRRRRTINEINMVPFIDVMLVLLIIFMVTAPLIAPSVIELPSVGRATKAPDQVIVVMLAKDESLSVKTGDSTQSITLKDLPHAVRSATLPSAGAAASGSTAVVISADKQVKYESVVKVVDSLQRAGIQRVGLSVQLAN
ncbi:MAG: hypothetical protein RLZZ126_1611 [Pseudomonadota bacterium]|jgi:biopolymer transport protein TolR